MRELQEQRAMQVVEVKREQVLLVQMGRQVVWQDYWQVPQVRKEMV